MHTNRAKMVADGIIYILFTACIFCWGMATGDSHPSSISSRPDTNKIIVELLIACDKEFGDLFQHDRQRIVDFWAVQLWDVNMRFKSLRRLDISVKLNQLITFNTTKDQHFIEVARNLNGEISLWTAMQQFTNWVASDQNLTKFDVAFLATGAPKVEKGSLSWAIDWKSACKRGKNTFIIHFDSIWGNICGAVADPLAHVMGAPPNDPLDEASGCKDKGFIRTRECGKNQYFFSKCSDEAMANYILSDDGKCMRTVDAPTADVILHSSKVTHPPTLQEQCRSLTGNVNAVGPNVKDMCIKANCFVPKGGNLTFSKSFYPLDNSPCGIDKYCFRGRCLPAGRRLVNVATGKCLHSADRFLSFDYPIMVDCNSSTPTPLDQFMILDKAPNGTFLATPYSTADSSENEDKCLSLDTNGERLMYSKCSKDDQKWLRWNFVKLGTEKEDEFLLQHSLSKGCAGVDANGAAAASKICDKDNVRQHWKFYDDPLASASHAPSSTSWAVTTAIALLIAVFGIVAFFAFYRFRSMGRCRASTNSGAVTYIR